MPRMDEKRVNDARLKLALALPKDHPVVKQVDDVLHLMWVELGNNDVSLQAAGVAYDEALDIVETHTTLREVLGDWRRGIRDWDEVEAALKDALHAVEDKAEVQRGG